MGATDGMNECWGRALSGLPGLSFVLSQKAHEFTAMLFFITKCGNTQILRHIVEAIAQLNDFEYCAIAESSATITPLMTETTSVIFFGGCRLSCRDTNDALPGTIPPTVLMRFASN